MTTASSLTLTTMEVPAVEDSMEMASPYQGQADDFDIDIDLMEDNVSNMDSDMMGADDYPNTSQPSLFNTEANDDADMADEPSEGSMVDADVVDEDPDIDVQYEETTYEAEMLEGDQDEEVVAPVPSIHIEAQAGNDDPGNKPSGTSAETDEAQHQATRDGHETALPESGSVVNETQEPLAQDEVAPPVSSENQSGQPGHTEGDENAEPQARRPDIESQDTGKDTGSNYSAAEEHHKHVDASAESVEHVEPTQEANLTAPEPGNGNVGHLETNDLHEPEGQDTHEEDESLHPMKVLYLEAEISLFPPMEGDSAETFFLHDEDIAYDNVGKLFSCLREVLLDNVAENEVLVIDIDSLGIQLTEDSSHMSNITLHQILNVYLRLCHNDGNNEPEALYLTLSSRPAVHSELASLEAAANDGKGLSQVHPWSEFEDGDNEDPRVAENLVEESSGDQDHQDLSLHETQEPDQEQVVPSGAAEPVVHDTVEEDAQELPAEVVPESVSDDHDAQTELANHAAETQQAEGAGQADAPQHADGNGHETAYDYAEEQYDSEGPKTESTSTVVPPYDHVGAKEPSEDVSTDAAEDRLGEHDADFQDGGDPAGGGEGLNEQESSEQHDLYGFEGQEHEESHDELAREETFAFGANHDVHPVDFASVHDEGVSNDPDLAPDAQADAQDASVDDLHDIENQSNGQSETTVENPTREDSVTHNQAPEPEDDLLGIADDLLEGSAQDPKDGLVHIESADLEPELEDGETEAPTGDDLTADDDLADDGSGDYDEESYNILEFSEHIELGEADPVHTDSQTHENPSKRSREEDEWDFEETSALETKRRRPS